MVGEDGPLTDPLLLDLRADAGRIALAIVLCTVGGALMVLFALGRRQREPSRRDRSLLDAGAFAGLYGVRLLLETAGPRLLVGDAAWLAWARSMLEYLVPIPGALLFVRLFGARWRRLNVALGWAFVACAAVCIPYELVVGVPFAAQRVVNALVMVLMASFFLNLALPSREPAPGFNLIRAGALVFGLLVLNNHLRLVPMTLGGEPLGFALFIGALVLVTMRRAMADQASLLAMRGELETARRIQLSTIPRQAPRVEQLEIATLYRPAAEVGGDLYDFVGAEDGSAVGVLVADVAGHGVPAALLAAMLKMALAGRAERAREPAALLTELNLLLCGRLERQFITAAYVWVEPAAGRLRLATAGHPPPLLRRAAGAVEEIGGSGPILGRFARATYAETAATLAPGDRLLLYTDGLVEARDRAEEPWGEERLRAALAAPDGATLAPESLVARVAAWSGSATFEDDVTVVALRRTGSAAAR